MNPDVTLNSTGNLVYHGPREYVPEFFESLGFACPERKGVADFLQEVTSRKDQKVRGLGMTNGTFSNLSVAFVVTCVSMQESRQAVLL